MLRDRYSYQALERIGRSYLEKTAALHKSAFLGALGRSAFGLAKRFGKSAFGFGKGVGKEELLAGKKSPSRIPGAISTLTSVPSAFNTSQVRPNTIQR